MVMVMVTVMVMVMVMVMMMTSLLFSIVEPKLHAHVLTAGMCPLTISRL